MKNLRKWGKVIALVAMISLTTQGVLVPLHVKAAADTLFFDSFANNNGNTVSGWTESEDSSHDAKLDTDSPRSGSTTNGHVRLREDASITKTIITTGYENITLTYYWRGDSSAENSDRLEVSWRVGTSGAFTELASHRMNTTTWSALVSHSLGVSAADTSIQIRFTGDSSQDDEQARVDDITVTGDEIPPDPATISGQKFEDLDNDGSKDAEENGLNDWNIYLATTDLTLVDTQTTDFGTEDGQFTFSSVTPGSYYICEAVQPGWSATSPTNGTVRSLSGVGSVFCRPQITVSEAQVSTGNDFGNFELGSVTGYKWGDANFDGIWDEGESGVSDWTINLLQGESVVSSTTTNESGRYTFGNLAVGTYSLCEAADADWEQTLPTENEGCYDFSVTESGQVLGGDGQYDFGNGELGMIVIAKVTYPESSAQKFVFTGSAASDEAGIGNGETIVKRVRPGTSTTSEMSVEGWDLTAISCDDDDSSGDPDSLTATLNVSAGETVTCTFENTQRASLTITKYADPYSGSFQFDLSGPEQEGLPAQHTFEPDGTWSEGLDSLLPGDYSLTETILSPEDWSGSQRIACSGNGDNDPEGSLATAFNFSLNPGDQMDCVVNNTEYALISGQKFNDSDGTGTSTAGTVLSEWAITFDRQDDDRETEEDEREQSYEATTAENGGYSRLVPPGTYKVCETVQDGWHQSYPTDTTANSTSCDEINGYLLTVTAGETISGIDFGNYQYGSISGFKWNDTDADGQIDSEEDGLGLSGWTIELYAGDTLMESVTTEGGTYTFENIEPGTYTVREVQQDGWAQSYPENGYHTVTLTSGQLVINKNFGNVDDATISGTKWNDADGDGEFGEEGTLAEWTIYLDTNDNGVWDEDEPSSETNESGDYTFSGLLPGTYTVREVSQSGWSQTYPFDEAAHTVVLEVGEDAININFGNAESVVEFGFKFHDTDANGVWNDDESESGLLGWTIVATPITESGEADDSRSAHEATTDEDGYYELNFLPSAFGWWRISETVQPGWTQTTEPQYYDILVSGDGGACQEYGRQGCKFGNWQNSTVEVLKWEDGNGNGIRDWNDENENGAKDEDEEYSENLIEGKTMLLGRANGDEGTTTVEIISLAETNEDGVASFYVSQSGDYFVFESDDDNWTPTYPATRNDSLEIGFAEGVTTTALVSNRFYTLSVQAENYGQTITEGISATDATSTVQLLFGNQRNEEEETPQSTSTGGGGGGTGSGGLVTNLVVHSETTLSTDNSQNSITISWLTNKPGTSRVIYDTVSHAVLGEAPNYGYQFSTSMTDGDPMVVQHTVTITGLLPNTTYFFRPISSASPEVVGQEIQFTTAAVAGDTTNDNESEPPTDDSGTQTGESTTNSTGGDQGSTSENGEVQGDQGMVTQEVLGTKVAATDDTTVDSATSTNVENVNTNSVTQANSDIREEAEQSCVLYIWILAVLGFVLAGYMLYAYRATSSAVTRYLGAFVAALVAIPLILWYANCGLVIWLILVVFAAASYVVTAMPKPPTSSRQ